MLGPGNLLSCEFRVQKPGDLLGYDYDLGDHWRHDIRLISLFPAEDSDGRCQVCLATIANSMLQNRRTT